MLITLPRALRLLLMFEPSLRRSPVARVLLLRSDPARSTRLIFDCRLDPFGSYVRDEDESEGGAVISLRTNASDAREGATEQE